MISTVGFWGLQAASEYNKQFFFMNPCVFTIFVIIHMTFHNFMTYVYIEVPIKEHEAL